MIPYLIPRSNWEEPGWTVDEHTNSGPHPYTRTEALIVHYTGAASTPENEASVRDFIRRTQRDYAANRGYSIGYNWCVDRQGRVWELRGDDYKCGANGNPTTNNDPAVLCLVNGANPANTPMIAGVRDVVEHVESMTGHPVTIKGHRDVRATACPGNGLYAQVQNGTFRPIDESDDEMQYLTEPYRIYDTRTLGGPLEPNVARQVPIGHKRAHVVVTCLSDTGQRGWVSVAGTPTAAGRTSVLNFEEQEGTQIRNGSVPLSLPKGFLYVKTSVSCHVIVDVFAVGD